MEQGTPQGLDMSAMRQKLRASRESAPTLTKAHSQSYIPHNPNYTAPPVAHNPHIQRQPSLSDRLEQHKSTFTHLHNYWHFYIIGMTFLLFHTMGMFPQWFPGTGNMESLYSRAPLIAFFFLSLPTVFVFFVLTNLRRSLQNAANISESGSWTKLEWSGAAIMFGLVFYVTFLKADPLEAYMVEDAIKGPFELTQREWIMAGVKCVGGAVTGALLARKFFGDITKD